MNKLLTLSLTLLLFSYATFADDRYWIGASDGNWNNTANWSETSGGTPGVSVPGTTDNVFFDNKGLGNVLIDINYSIATLSVDGGFTSEIDFDGNTLTIVGSENVDILGGTLSNGALIINDADRDVNLKNCLLNVTLNLTSGQFYYSNMEFGEEATFTLTGTPELFSYGSNTFKKTAYFINNSSSYLEIASNQTNIFEGDLHIENKKDGEIMLVKVGTTTIKGDLTYLSNYTAVSSTTTNFYVVNNVAAKLNIEGSVTLETQNTQNQALIKFPVNGQVTIDQDLTINNSATSSQSLIYVSGNAKSKINVGGNLLINNDGATGTKKEVRFPDKGEVFVFGTTTMNNTATSNQNLLILGKSGSGTFHQSATFNNEGTNNKSEIIVGESGSFIFNGDVTLTNNSTATNAWIEVSKNSGTSVTFNGDITLENTESSSGYIQFGAQGGTTTLADTQKIQIAGDLASNYQTDLHLYNFTQTGTTAQTLQIANGVIDLSSASFDGEVTFEAPQIKLGDNVFNAAAILTQNGTEDVYSKGNNTFNGITQIINTGTGTFRTGNNSGNVYNDQVTYETTTGTIEETSVSKTVYKGDVILNTNGQVELGRGASGVIEFSGVADQKIEDASGNSSAIISHLIVNTGGDLHILSPTTIKNSIDFTNGIVQTDAFNVFQLNNGGTVSNASDLSHVNGPITKVGADAIIFPIGDGNAYHPMGISNPPGTNSSFVAEYFVGSSNLSNKEVGIENVSTCEYWKLTNAQNHAVEVSLLWDDCSEINDYSTLAIGKYDGSEWKNYGNAGIASDEAAKRAISGTTLSSLDEGANFITFITTSPSNDLPVELLYFDAQLNNGKVTLQWATATEKNNDHFVISKSTDHRNWQDIKKIRGNGNSQTKITYQYAEEAGQDAVIYYQLKQVDFDGTEEVFPSIRINNSSEDTYLYAYPNPATSNLIIEGTDLQTLQLFHFTGVEVTQKVFQKAMHENKVQLDISTLIPGVYVIKTRYENLRVVKE
ncbi:T9SS type A sorting domain-containing protein [Flammeovirga pacifica]|uniref:Secretion system C-terminal sorting domain-containing protein n=1 Tax=Flammeovirga pacifica TaxID=915059 RepID=A0A1S1YVP6_FLAPC|nr:T9SS type A sorting domain-containing protein [Flammeovirga pacifica]OHX65104.1 hypothetical protein NH26_01420 [Flammeovirga pacifica]